MGKKVSESFINESFLNWFSYSYNPESSSELEEKYSAIALYAREFGYRDCFNFLPEIARQIKSLAHPPFTRGNTMMMRVPQELVDDIRGLISLAEEAQKTKQPITTTLTSSGTTIAIGVSPAMDDYETSFRGLWD